MHKLVAEIVGGDYDDLPRQRVMRLVTVLRFTDDEVESDAEAIAYSN